MLIIDGHTGKKRFHQIKPYKMQILTVVTWYSIGIIKMFLEMSEIKWRS